VVTGAGLYGSSNLNDVTILKNWKIYCSCENVLCAIGALVIVKRDLILGFIKNFSFWACLLVLFKG